MYQVIINILPVHNFCQWLNIFEVVIPHTTSASAGLHQMRQGCVLPPAQAWVPPSCSGTVKKHEQQHTQQLEHALALLAAAQHLNHLVPVIDTQIARGLREYAQLVEEHDLLHCEQSECTSKGRQYKHSKFSSPCFHSRCQ
jgi:hypothetical protein